VAGLYNRLVKEVNMWCVVGGAVVVRGGGGGGGGFGGF